MIVVMLSSRISAYSIYPSPPERLVQQSLTPDLGKTKALQGCAPTCFFMVAKAAGYLHSGVGSDLVSFCQSLDWNNDRTAQAGWIRPRLAEDLRLRYGMRIVSWQLNGNHDATPEMMARMRAAGYLETDEEMVFFQNQVADKDLSEIVAAGYPVIVGVKAGFGKNASAHAVVISNWNLEGVEVLDPDARNPYRHYTAEYVRQFLNPRGGGCTIVLPRPSSLS